MVPIPTVSDCPILSTTRSLIRKPLAFSEQGGYCTVHEDINEVTIGDGLIDQQTGRRGGKVTKRWTATDLFSGCGGLTDGLKSAGLKVVSAVELEPLAAETYKLNHPDTNLVPRDITKVEADELRPEGGGKIHVVAGCPPCQGFSRVRRHNRPDAAADPRNDLIGQFQKMVEGLEPDVVFLENVPGIENDSRFVKFVDWLKAEEYDVNWEKMELSEYGVPQRRWRVVVLAGKGFRIEMPTKRKKPKTVRDAIEDLPLPADSHKPLHNQVTEYADHVMKRIKAVPKDGGSRSDWPDELKLECHETCDGFKDVYGRMAWDEPAPTITGGCINASKGRFLHPEQDRAITLFEAALLQSFRRSYKFSLSRGRYPAAEMIGNALPPAFAERVGERIIEALEKHCSG